MIFTVNFNTEVDKGHLAASGTLAKLAWSPVSEDSWSLALLEPCPGLQGLNVRMPLAVGAVKAVIAGDLFQEQTQPYFLRNIARNTEYDKVELSLDSE